MSTGSVLDNGSLIRKVWLPIEVFPIATVLFNLVQYLLALLVLLPMALLLFQVSLSWSVVAFVPVLILQVVFTLGLCFLFSSATVFYRDIKHFTEIVLMLLFWLTPIVYDARTLPETVRRVISVNPLSAFIGAYHDIFYRQSVPDFSAFAVLVFLSLLSLTLGYGIFGASRGRLAEEV